MIKVKEYRGHIRNWEELCERLDIPLDLTREEREEQILVKAYETWGNEMADHMHGMFAFALWNTRKKTVRSWKNNWYPSVMGKTRKRFAL